MEKKYIKELVVVEGKTDSQKLNKLFHVQTYEMHGVSLNKKKIEEIVSLSKNRGIILFFDPDHAGEKIRNYLVENIPNTKNCFLNKKRDFINNTNKKYGLAEADDEAIIKAFQNVATFSNNEEISISWDEYLNLNLINDKSKREKLCQYLNISYYNNKKLFKTLNLMKLTFNDCNDILKKFII